MNPGSGGSPASRPRPAIVTLCPDLEAPGAGRRHVIERALALASREVDVALVGRSLPRTQAADAPPRVSRLRAAGSEIELWRPLSAPRFAPRSIAKAAALWKLLRCLRRSGRLDLLDVVGRGTASAQAAWVARRLGIPVSVTLAGAPEPLAAASTRWLRRTDRVICTDEASAGALRELGVREPAVVPEAVATRYRPLPQDRCRDELGLVRKRRLVLCVADLEPGGGQPELLRAVAALPAPGWQRPIVVLIGDGSDRSALVDLAADLDLSDLVCFEGDPHLDRLPFYYGAADLVVRGARGQGGERSGSEAAACGRKAVATERTVLREALEHILAEPAPEFGAVAPIDRRWNDVAEELLELWQVLLPRPNSSAAGRWSGRNAGYRARAESITGVGSEPDSGAGATPHPPPSSTGWMPIANRGIVYHHRTQGSGVEGVHIRGVVAAMRKLGAVVSLIEPPGVRVLDEGDCRQPRGSASPKWLGRTMRRFASGAPAWLFAAAELGYNILAVSKLWSQLRRGDRLLYERYALFGFAGVLAARGKTPVLLEVNDATVIERSRRTAWGGLARALECSVMRRAARILAVSDTIRLRLLGLGLDPSRIVAVANASEAPNAAPGDRDRIRRHFGGDAPVLAGVCGAFLPWHGLDMVVDALVAELRSGELGLLFIGDGPVRDTIEAQVRKLGVEDRVAFTGRVPASEVSAYLSALDIALLPDVATHASPMKLFEYMAHGLAIVAPDVASIRSVVEAERDALLFGRGDREGLRRRVRALIDDPRARLEMGRRAALSWAQAHTWDQNIQRIFGQIGSALEAGGAIHRGSRAERSKPC